MRGVNAIANSYYFPWRDGNHFELLVDSGEFYPAMLEAIEHARVNILLELYLFESGHVAERFINAFIQAAERGVGVYLLLDDFGARGLNRQDRKRLYTVGVHLSYYNPLHYGKLRRNLFRDHRKLLLVDGHTAFTGGAGITDNFDPHSRHNWHETMIRIQGPCVADWQSLFQKVWNRWGTPPLTLPQPSLEPCADGRPGRVTLNAPVHKEIKRSLLKRIRGAERRVWIATAYFIPSRKIRRALKRAARNGVDVRLLLPGQHTDHPAIRHAGRRYYAKLLHHGVRIFEYQPRFLHTKLLLCDDWLSTGSSNIDRWNLSWNLEANQESDDQALADRVERLLEEDFNASEEFLFAQWRHRGRFWRLLEWFWGKVELWLERHSQRRPKGPE